MTPRVLIIFLWGVLAIAHGQTQSGRNASLSGCLDEKPGPQYVLRGLNQLKLIAELEPEGFPVQNFAKFLGRRVRVAGRIDDTEERVVMRVRRIEQLPGPCAPPAQDEDDRPPNSVE
jgi:hypothetical protein